MRIQRWAAVSVFFLGLSVAAVSQGATLTWDGGGANNNWNTALNWNTNSAPAANDALSFDGVARTSTHNNLAAATQINGLTFNSTAGAFTLSGNQITLHGDVVDNRQVRPQTINLDLVLDATRNIDVVGIGSLTVNGAISGPGSGLTKTGPGDLNLFGGNSFGGTLTIKAGKVNVNSIANLGSGNVVLDGGTLRSTGAGGTLTIASPVVVGPASGSGSGSLEVGRNDNIVAHSITNNGVGSGSLIKKGLGDLILDGFSTYSGSTIIQQGRILVDFSGAGGPTSNLISPGSPLLLNGGATGEATQRSFATIRVDGDASAVTSQTFANTLLDVGAARILVFNSAGVSTTLGLSSLTHNPGAIAVVATSTNSHVTTTTTNTNGILGGWAAMGSLPTSSVAESPNNSGIARAVAWASVDGGGNIVPYVFQGNETYVTGDVLHTSAAFLGTNRNLLVAAGSSGNVIINTTGAGTTTDINTIEIAPSTTNLNGRAIEIGASNTLRLGKYGGLMRADTTTNNVIWSLGTPGVQDSGTLTAGGAANTAGEIVFTTGAPDETEGTFNVEAAITDNGSGAVTVVKAGGGSMKLRGHNTYSGGTYILQGRVQLAGVEIGTANSFGSGPVTVLQGGQLFFSGNFGMGSGTITNELRIAGNGLDEESTGAIRVASGNTLAGTITLLNDARIAGGGFPVEISGKITGPHSITFGTPNFLTTQIMLSNPLNDWTGNTSLLGRNSSQDFAILLLGANEVIPDGYSKGDLILQGSGTPGALSLFVLAGFNETVNGLVSSGTITSGNVGISNDRPGTTSLLTVGNSDQTATFAGVIFNGTNPSESTLAFRKIGLGTQTLSGAHTYSGTTTVSAGTLLVNGSHSGAGSYVVDAGATLGGTGSISLAGGASMTVNGILSPGASIESLDVTGPVSFGASSTLFVELDGTSNLIDLLDVMGNISITNGAVAQFLVTGTPTLAEYVFATYTGSLTGSFNSTSVPAGYSLVQGGGELRLVQVPEPSTWLLAGIGCIGAAWLARRRSPRR